MVDRHYSPGVVADRLVGEVSVSNGEPRRIVDFAAGQGALLEALSRRFPKAEVSASDADAHVIRQLRVRHLRWRCGRADFLSVRSRAASAIANGQARYDLVALNPPFSYRGAAAVRVLTGSEEVLASPAAAFVLIAADYVTAGQLLAVLPAGTLTSERDAAAWELLRGRWLVEQRADFGRGVFPGLAARSVLVSLMPRPTMAVRPHRERRGGRTEPMIHARMVRGCTPVHRTRRESNGRPFVHTTGLARHGVETEAIQDVRGGRAVSGHVVLIPRVGNPVPWKIHAATLVEPTILSDCVIALVCETRPDAEAVSARLQQRWVDVRRAWDGSCAMYTTMSRLAGVLREQGVVLASDQNFPSPVRLAA